MFHRSFASFKVNVNTRKHEQNDLTKTTGYELCSSFPIHFFILNMFMKSAVIPHLNIFEIFGRNIFRLENWWSFSRFRLHYPGTCMFKVNNGCTSTVYQICSQSRIKTPPRRHWHLSGVFVVNFEHNSLVILFRSLLTLNKKIWLVNGPKM